MPWRDWQHDIERQFCGQAGYKVEVIIVPQEGYLLQANAGHLVNQAMLRQLRSM